MPININLQAHKGVEIECPENTFPAFDCAVKQGYDVIELDLEYTKDKKIVVIHDKTINRTARNNDGTLISKKIFINEISYEQALLYDYGIWFANKYKNTKIPLFSDVLEFAKKNNIRLKIDNKIQSFPDDILKVFFELIESFEDICSITSNDIYFIEKCHFINENISFDYDGVVNEEILIKLTNIINYDKLTIWVPFENEKTKWVKLPTINLKLSNLIKKYAKIGVWLINNYNDYNTVVSIYNPNIIETDGTIKPIINKGKYYDMHTHSKNSHDSNCDVKEIVIAGINKNLQGIAITDHCDVEYYQTIDLDKIIINSLSDINSQKNKNIQLLKGIEIGEGIWNNKKTNEIINKYNFDVVIGSIHAVRYKDYTKPYSRIDFSKIDKEIIIEYINQYFDDMLEMILISNIDVLAHMTCPFRYIIGKYGILIDIKIFTEKIRNILNLIIEKKIALEINTSCLNQNNKYNNLLPEKWIINMYKQMNGYLITLASDAHISSNVGNHFDDVLKLLKEEGFINIYYYLNRLPIQCTII